MIPYGREFQVAQFISTLITGLSLIYMLRVSACDGRWIPMTIAVSLLFISTVFGFMREIMAFDLMRTIEWVFIMLSAAMFLYASLRSNRKLEAET
ncbi:hypothetical protein [Methanothermobacter sp.]|uniref:hypothetical protein n=1 Tax=Methanothermobacter sp. TaxID=1884223 RepID=UPI00262C3C63|nr:hypothetical protein [Methanothermobacter sp.]MDI9615159.1 hypothetical protein [Methanothermobacter sp.]